MLVAFRESSEGFLSRRRAFSFGVPLDVWTSAASLTAAPRTAESGFERSGGLEKSSSRALSGCLEAFGLASGLRRLTGRATSRSSDEDTRPTCSCFFGTCSRAFIEAGLRGLVGWGWLVAFDVEWGLRRLEERPSSLSSSEDVRRMLTRRRVRVFLACRSLVPRWRISSMARTVALVFWSASLQALMILPTLNL